MILAHLWLQFSKSFVVATEDDGQLTWRLVRDNHKDSTLKGFILSVDESEVILLSFPLPEECKECWLVRRENKLKSYNQHWPSLISSPKSYEFSLKSQPDNANISCLTEANANLKENTLKFGRIKKKILQITSKETSL